MSNSDVCIVQVYSQSVNGIIIIIHVLCVDPNTSIMVSVHAPAQVDALSCVSAILCTVYSNADVLCVCCIVCVM